MQLIIHAFLQIETRKIQPKFLKEYASAADVLESFGIELAKVCSISVSRCYVVHVTIDTFLVGVVHFTFQVNCGTEKVPLCSSKTAHVHLYRLVYKLRISLFRKLSKF